MRASPSRASLLVDSLARRGVGATLRMWHEEWSFDRRHRVDTRGRIDGSALTDPQGARARLVTEYQAVPAALFRASIVHVPGAARRGTFVDVGAGKGRALMLAAEAGFERVLGVEQSAELCEVARRNLRSFEGRRAHLQWSIEQANAAERDFAPDETTVFLFHPFGRMVLRRVLDRLEMSLARAPRALAVVYVNPHHGGLLADSPALREAAVGRSRVPGALDYAVFVTP